MTHRALSLGEPHYLNSLLIPRLNTHSLHSSSLNPLVLPFFNKMSNCFCSFAYNNNYNNNNANLYWYKTKHGYQKEMINDGKKKCH